MAQTRRKRRTKHRGTAAGNISVRGRTGRPPTPEERKKQARVEARERRLNKPPTWKSSFFRAGLAGMGIFVFIALTTKGKGSSPWVAAALFAIFATALYIPAGYYLELWMYRRRQQKKATAEGKR